MIFTVEERLRIRYGLATMEFAGFEKSGSLSPQYPYNSNKFIALGISPALVIDPCVSILSATRLHVHLFFVAHYQRDFHRCCIER